MQVSWPSHHPKILAISQSCVLFGFLFRANEYSKHMRSQLHQSPDRPCSFKCDAWGEDTRGWKELNKNSYTTWQTNGWNLKMMVFKRNLLFQGVHFQVPRFSENNLARTKFQTNTANEPFFRWHEQSSHRLASSQHARAAVACFRWRSVSTLVAHRGEPWFRLDENLGVRSWLCPSTSTVLLAKLSWYDVKGNISIPPHLPKVPAKLFGHINTLNTSTQAIGFFSFFPMCFQTLHRGSFIFTQPPKRQTGTTVHVKALEIGTDGIEVESRWRNNSKISFWKRGWVYLYMTGGR